MAEKCIWNVQNLDCAACAATIEEELNKVEGVKQARVDYAKKQIHVQSTEDRDDAFFQSLIAEAKRVEPALKVSTQPYKEKKTSSLMMIRIASSALFFALAFFLDTPPCSIFPVISLLDTQY